MKRYQVVRIAEEVQILRERATTLHYTYIAYLVIFRTCVLSCRLSGTELG